MSDSDLRRIEKLEERMNGAERDITAVTERQALIKENLKDEIERVHADLRERLDDLKGSVKGETDDLHDDIAALTASIEALNKQVQNVYVTQSGANTKISLNEKIIWAIVALLSTGALYLVQELIKGSGAS